MTREPRHRNRFIARRPRTSTLVLIALFLGFFTLYVWVRPVTAADSGNVQQGNTAPSQAPSAPAYTPTPAHTLSPTRSATPSVTPATHPTSTPAPTTPATSATATATPTTSPSASTSSGLPPAGSP